MRQFWNFFINVGNFSEISEIWYQFWISFGHFWYVLPFLLIFFAHFGMSWSRTFAAICGPPKSDRGKFMSFFMSRPNNLFSTWCTAPHSLKSALAPISISVSGRNISRHVWDENKISMWLISPFLLEYWFSYSDHLLHFSSLIYMYLPLFFWWFNSYKLRTQLWIHMDQTFRIIDPLFGHNKYHCSIFLDNTGYYPAWNVQPDIDPITKKHTFHTDSIKFLIVMSFVQPPHCSNFFCNCMH